MKILIIADIHLGSSYPYSKRNSNGLLDRQLDILEIFENIFKKEFIKMWDLMIIAGDFFDKDMQDGATLDIAAKIIRFMNRSDKPIIILKGNHDDDKIYPPIKSYENFNFKNIQIVDKFKSIIISRINNNVVAELMVLLQPFNTLEKIEENLNNSKKIKKITQDGIKKFSDYGRVFVHTDCPRVYVGHYAIKDTEFAKSVCEVGIQKDSVRKLFNKDNNFDWAIFGHHHKSQNIFDDTEKAFYIGSPYQKDFGEKDEEHGFYIIDTVSMEKIFYKTNAPRFVEMDYKAIKRQVSLKNKIIKVIFKDKIVDDKDAMEGIKKLIKLRGARHIVTKIERPRIKKFTPFGGIDITTPQRMAQKYVDKVLDPKAIDSLGGKDKILKVGINLLQEASKNV